jgi:sugar transferase (PEP-CTERM/EpsH1 system associated)
MRLLFLTSRLPYPPDRGDKRRTNQFLKLFSGEHSVTLVSFFAEERERLLAEELRPYCEAMHLIHLPLRRSVLNVALNFWRDLPLQALYYRSPQMERVLSDLLSQQTFDLAYVHLFRMAPYLIGEQQLYRILDLTDLISYELRLSIPYQSTIWRSIYRIEEPRIARFEQRIASKFDEVWFISRRDRDLFQVSEDETKLQVIPSFTEDNLFNLKVAASDAPNLVFVGNMDVMHNIDAARYLVSEIMPHILSRFPECRLLIAASGEGKEVRKMSGLPGVRVLDYAEDLRTVFENSMVAVAPLRFSAGIQFKIIEPMAAGLPVVASTNATAGLGATPGQDLLVADDAEDFAWKVILLLSDESLRRRIAGAGREFVQTNFSSRTAVHRLRKIDNRIGAA